MFRMNLRIFFKLAMLAACGQAGTGAQTPGPAFVESAASVAVEGLQVSIRICRPDVDMLAAYGTDGHSLFFARNGSRIWGPLLVPFLAAHRGAD